MTGSTLIASAMSGQCSRRLAITRARARALAHPVAQDRQRRLPQVELGIELAAEALDVEQRLLQQDQLRLDLHLVAARDLEQVHQHDAEGDVLERLVEDRLADRAHGGLELVHARAGRHPAALEVQHRDPAVVALEEGEEVAGEVELVARVERADDAEVDRGVARVRGIADVHEDVSRVHVGVEEVVAEHLREEDRRRRSRRASGCRCRARAAARLRRSGCRGCAPSP